MNFDFRNGVISGSVILLRGNAPLPPRLFEKEWLAALSGHGCSSRFGLESPEHLLDPENCVSFVEACKKVDCWCRHADTIGGDGDVIHVPTFLESHPDWRDNFPFIEKRRPTVGEELMAKESPVVKLVWA